MSCKEIITFGLSIIKVDTEITVVRYSSEDIVILEGTFVRFKAMGENRGRVLRLSCLI